jgi:transcriptional regulator with XRE-family HTH domain
MNIAAALKEARLKKFPKQKVKQYEIAKKIGITQAYLSQIESGGKVPTLEVICKICKAYKTPFSILLWFALDEKDIQRNKLDAYRKMKPVIDSMINNFI